MPAMLENKRKEDLKRVASEKKVGRLSTLLRPGSPNAVQFPSNTHFGSITGPPDEPISNDLLALEVPPSNVASSLCVMKVKEE
jgi:hypothetical protein